MHDFYTADPIFERLRIALIPPKVIGNSASLRKEFETQLAAIRTSVRTAEKLMSPFTRKECAVHLRAAKANQVKLLADVDGTSDDMLPATKRDELHEGCVELGTALTKMMLQATELATTSSVDQMSPPHAQQKRAQGHPDSPVLTATSPKRRKADAPPAQLPGSSSSPGYKAVAANNPTLPSSATDDSTAIAAPAFSAFSALSTPSAFATSTTSGSAPATDSPARSSTRNTSSPSPVKRHRLTAQPKPRPASQLFAAPPDFKAGAKVAPVLVVKANDALSTEQSAPPVGAVAPDAE